jgi:hypothetical protein
MKDKENIEKGFQDKWGYLRKEESFKVPENYFEDLEAGILQKVKTSQNSRGVQRWLPGMNQRRTWLSIAAGFAIIICVGVAYVIHTRNASRQQDEILGTLAYIDKHAGDFDLKLLSLLTALQDDEPVLNSSEMEFLDDMNLQELEELMQDELEQEL